jgi:Serine carboxypeptidase
VAPLPADAHIAQLIQRGGRTMNYTSRLARRQEDGRGRLHVVHDGGREPRRHVRAERQPDAASVFPNFGAIGPNRVEFGDQGDSPSDPATLVENPGTWPNFSDLVFIDPIGTGFSQSLVPADQR